jgi:3-methyladenine DNA glycosylase AlkD
MAASLLLGVYPKIRKELDPHLLDKWLSKLAGWVEIDTLCQSTFTASELLQEWDIWLLLLREFNKSSDISKRRASLVLLVKPVRESADPRLAKIAFENIDRLRFEKEILITKAISWLLRVLIKHHRTEVEAYLTKRAEDLPKIALRETHKKLDTGKKN